MYNSNSESFTFILKSCVILAIWLALISASLWDSFTIKHNNQSDIKTCLKEPIKLQENERQLLQLFTN